MSIASAARRSHIVLALSAIAAALTPGVAGAQASTVSTSPPAQAAHSDARAPRVEYALYVGNGVGGARVFATATSDVRGKNWREFAQRLQAERFPEYPRTEPAFFTWLAERGWELVECERREETVALLGDRDVVTRCHFRRTVAGVADASVGGGQ